MSTINDTITEFLEAVVKVDDFYATPIRHDYYHERDKWLLRWERGGIYVEVLISKDRPLICVICDPGLDSWFTSTDTQFIINHVRTFVYFLSVDYDGPGYLSSDMLLPGEGEIL